MNELRVICIGGWGHWDEVFSAFKQFAGVRVLGVAPAYEGEDLSLISSHPLLTDGIVYPSMDELLSVPSDFCVVSTRPGHIASVLVCAANAGVDIITEKPLGISLDELEQVERAVRENDVRLMAMLTLRGFAVFQTARRLYSEGAIGRAVLVNVRKSYKYGNEKLRPEWFGVRSEYGGTLPWVGIHGVDMVRFITGLKPVRVAAIQKNTSHQTHPECEDACSALFEMNQGAQMTLSVDYFRPEVSGTHGDDWIRIVGTEGILEARENEKICTLLRNGEVPEIVDLDQPELLYDAFFKGGIGMVTRDDAFELTKACLIARQAADQGQWLEID